ncbi:MAG: hypothetical protein JWP91_908 [Fibrobacteres bacterium]|nr:hypothetical protein [Fibrobacterota bacterium]
MEDVLLSYLQSRKRPTSGDAAGNKAVEPASWTAPASLAAPVADPFVKPSLPYPLSALFTLVDSHEEYPGSCKALGEFLKKLCGQHPLENVLLQTLQTRFPRVWMERFLFILLEVQATDWQTAAYALQFRHLKRLLLRVERKKPLNAVESGLARELINALSLSRFQDFEPFCRHAAETFKAMQAGRIPVSGDLGLLVYLIRSECAAMGERKNWLENDLATGEPDTVARLSPHLKLLEDRMHKAQELAQRLGSYGPIQDGPMGLEDAMGPFFFNHLKECLGKLPSLAGLKQALELQQSKRVPTRDLIALSTLSRWLMEARGAPAGPLEWVRMALESYDRGHFRLDVAGGLPAVEALLTEARVEREGTLVLGNFGENPYSSWIARDGLTRPYRSSNPDRIAPDLKSLVLGNLHRDNIIMKMLDNPKVYGTPGLIEAIVEGSRSALVHNKIATRRELHAGSVNGRVPVALLRSQVSISNSLLRCLIHPSIIPFSEMKTLYRGRSALRHEVVEELHTFLKQAYAL